VLSPMEHPARRGDADKAGHQAPVGEPAQCFQAFSL